MKSLLKFTLLSALIITGKLAKDSALVPVVQAPVQTTKTTPNPSVVMVHETLTSQPVPQHREQAQPQQSGNGLLAELF